MPKKAAFLLCLVLAACEPNSPKPMDQAQGRAETKAVRNTESIGVSGNAIANKVDGALNANDQRGDALDKAMDAQEAEQ